MYLLQIQFLTYQLINCDSQGGSDDIQKILSGHHTWHATSHARPTYCNVCREQLSGEAVR